MHQSSVHKYEHLPFHVEIRWLNVKTLHGTAAQRLLQVSLQDLSTVVSPPEPPRFTLARSSQRDIDPAVNGERSKIAHVFAADILRVRGVACVYLGRSSHARTAFDGDGCDGWTGAAGKLEEPTDSNFPRSIRANGGSG